VAAQRDRISGGSLPLIGALALITFVVGHQLIFAATYGAAAIAPIVSRLFDDVMLVAEDGAVRGNRLRLLLDVRDRLGRLGDFSQIPR